MEGCGEHSVVPGLANEEQVLVTGLGAGARRAHDDLVEAVQDSERELFQALESIEFDQVVLIVPQFGGQTKPAAIAAISVTRVLTAMSKSTTIIQVRDAPMDPTSTMGTTRGRVHPGAFRMGWD